jgi:tRNA(Arg) A34 adenosine deaminase TadA
MAAPATSFAVSLPDWAAQIQNDLVLDNKRGKRDSDFDSPEARMDFVNGLARRNFEQQTGGPFAAAVFWVPKDTTGTDKDSKEVLLVSLGVNRVVHSNCSSAHAEVVALSLAQRNLETWDLSALLLQSNRPHSPTNQPFPQSGGSLELVVNWRPCAMCFGAVLWGGVTSLVVAGDGKELEELTGFDEGPVTPEWREELRKRGISLTEDVRRTEAVEVFRAFGEDQKKIVYNARRGLIEDDQPNLEQPRQSAPKVAAMTLAEKQQLAANIAQLDEDALANVVAIIRQGGELEGEGGDEIELDIDRLSMSTLRALETFVQQQ